MGILFATSDSIAIPSIRLLHQQKTISAILTVANNTGKTNNNTSIISQFAKEHSIPLLQPETLDEKFTRSLAAHSTDLLVCFAYGKYFANSFLSHFPKGSINVHPSLLPRFRGASPIVAAILAGDTETGISIQTISSRLDAGDIAYQMRFPIEANTTSASLRKQVASQIAQPLLDICQQLLTGMSISYTEQHDNSAVYCRKIRKTDGKILWSMPAEHINRLVKSMCYWPCAYTYFNDKKLNILETQPHHLPQAILTECNITTNHLSTEILPFGKVLGIHNRYGIMVQTGKDLLGIHTLQLATRKTQHWKDFINGHKTIIGSILGQHPIT